MPGSLRDRIADAQRALIEAGLPADDAAFDAEVLARHALGWDRAALLARGREAPPAGFAERFGPLIDRRIAREPVALIVGHREFWDLEFAVTRDVLIPRPETELIVEEAIDRARSRASFRRIVDVGTGSGCLAVSLAKEFADARVTATDISRAALHVARRNAAAHGVEHRIAFVATTFLDAIRGPADLIVSNPPYVPETAAATLPPEVIRFEPATALFGGRDGLSAFRAIFSAAPRVLAADGLLVVEFGFEQEDDLRREAARAGWEIVHVRADLQGVPRVAVLRR